jgi:Ca2+-binding RTX toxin-like protein
MPVLPPRRTAIQMIALGLTAALAGFVPSTAVAGESGAAVIDVAADPGYVLTDAPETIIGTPGDDVIVGVGSGDVVHSGAGDDTISFLENQSDEDGVTDAVVDAGPGEDLVILYHRNSRNSIDTGPGDDEISMASRNGANVIDTGQGDDIVSNGAEFSGHTISTGPGDDLVTGDNGEGGTVSLDTGPDNDQVLFGRITGTIITATGDDRIEFGTTVGNAYVDAGAGDDTVIPGGDAGGHTILGGPGADLVLLSSTNFNIVDLGGGDDALTAVASVGNAIDGASGFDVASFDAPTDPPNTCVSVEQATNC